jgi:hypothetical protein
LLHEIRLEGCFYAGIYLPIFDGKYGKYSTLKFEITAHSRDILDYFSDIYSSAKNMAFSMSFDARERI